MSQSLLCGLALGPTIVQQSEETRRDKTQRYSPQGQKKAPLYSLARQPVPQARRKASREKREVPLENKQIIKQVASPPLLP